MALASLSAMGWDHMYLVGPGTPDTGDGEWSLDNRVELRETYQGSNVWLTVCYLDLKENGSFRLQPNCEWDNQYYGPAVQGEVLENDTPAPLTFQTENCFKVATPGVYLLQADFNNNEVKINRMSAIYVVGDPNGWNVDNSLPLSNEGSDDKSVYSGLVKFGAGEFKLAVDPGNGLGFDNRYFLFKDTKQSFKTNPANDSKWKIGWPDQENRNDGEADITPGTFKVLVNAATKAVEFYMEAESVSLAGPGALASWDNQPGNPRLESAGNGVFTAKHIFLTPDGYFKPVIDDVYYGSDSWESKVAGDNETCYLRKVDSGADFTVSSPGFRTVTVAPSQSGDGTLSLTVGAPQSVWIEGLCAMKYDAATRSYITDAEGNDVNSLHYLSEENLHDYKVMIDGDEVASLSAASAGWYEASVTFDGCRPVYNLSEQLPVVYGSAIGEDMHLSGADLSGRSFLKGRVHLAEGTLSASIAGRESASLEIGKSGFYNMTVTPDETGVPVVSVTGPVVVNMPLTEGDFADGRHHYFLVGQRMGAWRLQPEWEFVKGEDGSYTIPERLLYNGYVMVGVVDNYEDYITQTYQGYSASDINAETRLDPSKASGDQDFEFPLARIEAVGNNGCADGKFTGTRYNDIKRTATPFQHGGFDGMKYRLINICDPDGYGDVEHIKSMPSRVNSIKLTVDASGAPVSLDFVGVNTDATEVARLRTFSLCGSGIRNLDVPYVNGVSTTPLNNNDGQYGGREWAESWIQFSAKDKPYVDGYGEYIYQTSFTRNWLSTHPTYFKFKTAGEAAGLEYTSNNVTFTYRPDIKHDAQFGNRTVTDQYGLERKETLYTYSTLGADGYEANRHAVQNLDDEMIVNPDDMVCFAVEDMWMVGDFKIWSGWGGSITNYEYDSNGTFGTRWFGSNASHGAQGENRVAFYTAGEVMAYTLFRDVPAANFAVGYGPVWDVENTYDADGNIVNSNRTLNGNVHETGQVKDGAVAERRFYKRVEIWFNLKSGFAYSGKDEANNGNSSFIVFYQELRGPQISIAKTDETHINYTYQIQDVNNMPLSAVDRTYGLITYYRIERIPLDEKGNEGEYALVEERHLPEGGYLSSEEFAKTAVNDAETLQTGRYRYQVTIKRSQTGAHEFPAKSNILAVVAPPIQSGVETVSGEGDGGFSMSLNAAEGLLRVNATSAVGNLNIYSVNGSLVAAGRIEGTAGMIDISSLPAGVYVANANNTSVRFIKR